MKDLELIIPYLREFLDERGLNDVDISLTLRKLPISVVNETFPQNESCEQDMILAKSIVKIASNKSDTFTLESKYF